VAFPNRSQVSDHETIIETREMRVERGALVDEGYMPLSEHPSLASKVLGEEARFGGRQRRIGSQQENGISPIAVPKGFRREFALSEGIVDAATATEDAAALTTSPRGLKESPKRGGGASGALIMTINYLNTN